MAHAASVFRVESCLTLNMKVTVSLLKKMGPVYQNAEFNIPKYRNCNFLNI
jgi:hypothetical protein